MRRLVRWACLQLRELWRRLDVYHHDGVYEHWVAARASLRCDAQPLVSLQRAIARIGALVVHAATVLKALRGDRGSHCDGNVDGRPLFNIVEVIEQVATWVQRS